jgi:hypothetical protein
MNMIRTTRLPFALTALLLSGCPSSSEGPPKDTAEVPDTPAPEDIVDATDTDADSEYTEEREACADRNPNRNLYFGDLHVHTRRSFDAWAYDVRTTPEEAYGFARGEAVLLPPLDADGVGTRVAKLERPLDFAAVTDHAEFLAETALCTTPGSSAYDTEICVEYRKPEGEGIPAIATELADIEPTRHVSICGEDLSACGPLAEQLWTENQAAAEAFYDRSEACTFTTFHAYEYTAATFVTNLHRNVIFRNANVPAVPTTYFEAPTAFELFQSLQTGCIEADMGCEVLSIPHNSNLSNGRMFEVIYPGASSLAEEAELAALRGALEPLVEIFQHKGDTECRNDLTSVLDADPLCDFEKMRIGPVQDCMDTVGAGAMVGLGCVSRLDFVRYVLAEGLREAERLGVNPFRLGVVGATDTHSGTPGHVDEWSYRGHTGNNEDDAEELLSPGDLLPGGIRDSPGGLMAVWAEENSRDRIFDAMQRRETYATSGTRIPVRLFGGWGPFADPCADPDWLDAAYADGVPMGGDLAGADDPTSAPTFAFSALKDAGTDGHPGVDLERIQIVKGWVDAENISQFAVFDVAGEQNPNAGVDLSSCTPTGTGSATLCGTWTDPDFDPTLRAFYYLRVLENPSCRHHTWFCLQFSEEDRPEGCDNPDVPATIQERAWSSPIWYTPPIDTN